MPWRDRHAFGARGADPVCPAAGSATRPGGPCPGSDPGHAWRGHAARLSHARAGAVATPSRSTSPGRASRRGGRLLRARVAATHAVTPEPQYATISSASRSAGGSSPPPLHGTFSAPGMRPGTRSIGFGSPRKRAGSRASTITRPGSSRRAAIASASRVSPERGRGSNTAGSTSSSPGRERSAPGVDPAGQNGDVVVPEVSEQPPEPLGATSRPVGDHEDARADPCPPGRAGERVRARQRVSGSALDRWSGEVSFDVEERGTGDVTGEVELPSALRLAELPAAVDEAIRGHPSRAYVTVPRPAAYLGHQRSWRNNETDSHRRRGKPDPGSRRARRCRPSRRGSQRAGNVDAWNHRERVREGRSGARQGSASARRRNAGADGEGGPRAERRTAPRGNRRAS